MEYLRLFEYGLSPAALLLLVLYQLHLYHKMRNDPLSTSLGLAWRTRVFMGACQHGRPKRHSGNTNTAQLDHGGNLPGIYRVMPTQRIVQLRVIGHYAGLPKDLKVSSNEV